MTARSSAPERWLPIPMLLFGFLVPACSTEPVATDPLGSEPSTGRILGLVLADGAPVSGIAITLSRAGSEFAMVVTTASGEFGFTDLEAGTYVLAISEISGMRCVTHQAATVAPGEETVVSFACATPAPPTPSGTVEGLVTVNGVGAGRIMVSLRDATRNFGWTITGNDGAYRFTGVPIGPKTAWIATEEPCPGTRQENARTQLEVTVSEGEVAVAHFVCTGQVITGTVRVNGIPASGLAVRVCYGLPVWDYGCVLPFQATDSQGRYAYTTLRPAYSGDGWSSLPPGEYVVFVESPPSGATCAESREVSLAAGALVTVDLACVPAVPPGAVPDSASGGGFWDY